MITHLQQKAFVRKYNSELAIKGYTKLTRASLFQRIENTLKRSRLEPGDCGGGQELLWIGLLLPERV